MPTSDFASMIRPSSMAASASGSVSQDRSSASSSGGAISTWWRSVARNSVSSSVEKPGAV
jgi:hypothetical protein